MKKLALIALAAMALSCEKQKDYGTIYFYNLRKDTVMIESGNGSSFIMHPKDTIQHTGSQNIYDYNYQVVCGNRIIFTGPTYKQNWIR